LVGETDRNIVSVHRPIARNFAVASENKIHSDAVAKRLGFMGALVPGVTVFGHLTWPLTKHLGASWLQSSFVTTRFLKPAYDGERLAVSHLNLNSITSVEAHNESGVLLATLECRIENHPQTDERAQRRSADAGADRVEIVWDSVQVDEPFATYTWTPDAEHNREYAARLDDNTELFKQGVVHPHALLSQANRALVRHFIMPAWIHTGSEIRFRNLVRVDDSIEVRTVPIEKWEKKGHQFIKLYIAYVRGEEVVTEIYHTAIFRIAGA
jgi:acyl dehydratase